MFVADVLLADDVIAAARHVTRLMFVVKDIVKPAAVKYDLVIVINNVDQLEFSLVFFLQMIM
jgi:hypothetical protein